MASRQLPAYERWSTEVATAVSFLLGEVVEMLSSLSTLAVWRLPEDFHRASSCCPGSGGSVPITPETGPPVIGDLDLHGG